MLKIWINGASGQLGKAINQEIDPMEYEIFNTDESELDITDMETVINFGEVNRPDIIINCTGITETELCEQDPRLAFKVNALGARNLSLVAAKIRAKIVQISTDDVFDGKSDVAYTEYDMTNPMTVYGKSKLAGENYVKEFTNRHFIIRSTWVYGEGQNFVRSFLEKVQNGEELSISSDQYGSPTSASELAKFILFIIHTNEYGTYHATCKGVVSRYEFAQEILNITGEKANMKAVPTTQSDFSKVRPPYAVLDNFVMSILGEYEFPEWKTALREYLNTERKA
ncbi:MAG: dTDP-4-dehydrorhamnose reductase [Lachnospiraceae bacterium]|nr:dTDP-4-dehydrorhamnose reductase [Lachnospiraceae bacterium]